MLEKSNKIWLLSVISNDGRSGTFDIRPYLEFEAFKALRDTKEFAKVSNCDYFVEWDCGADLSADTIEAKCMLSSMDISAPGTYRDRTILELLYSSAIRAGETTRLNIEQCLEHIILRTHFYSWKIEIAI